MGRPVFLTVAGMLLMDALLLVSWSGGFIGVRFASDYAPIFLILLWRSLLSGVILLPLALLFGPRMRWREIITQVIFGGFGMASYLGTFALAIGQGVPTGLVALITDMLPLAVAVLSWPVLGERLNRRQWLGTVIGLAGVLLACGGSLHLGGGKPWAYGLPILGTVALAIVVLLQKRWPSQQMAVHQSLALQCLAAAAVFGLFAWHDGGVLPVMRIEFIGGILWLVFVATFMSWGIYYLALRRSSPARVSAVLYMSPPMVMVWAWAMFGESLSWAMAIGLAVSLAGIIIVARATPKPLS
ncbi:MAG: DMT family transporter [Rhizobiales bacterium]|nr:DMT family transporter [Hyphomicrobiales bacterium]